METEQKIYKFAANFPRFNYVCLGNQDTAAAIGDWTECGSRTKPSDGEILATDQRDNLVITYWECSLIMILNHISASSHSDQSKGRWVLFALLNWKLKYF